MLSPQSPAARIARASLAIVGVVLTLGGIPGARLRSITYRAPYATTVQASFRDAVVNVTVHDGAQGPPLAGANVRVLAMAGDRAEPAGNGTSNARGVVHLDHLPRGEAWILADAPGRARGSVHLLIGPDTRDVDIDLGPGHTIEVRVHDELGAPLAGSELEVLSSADPLPVGGRTSADGGAIVDRLGVGPWHITAREPGYEEAVARAEHDGEVVSLVLRKLGALMVHVYEANDRDAAKARVSVAGVTLWPARSAETDLQGDVRIAGLSAGTYGLRATLADAVSTTELGVALARGEEKRVVLRLGPGRFANIRVTDGEARDADPIAGARVTLAEGGLSLFPLEATTDRKGRARLGPFAPGGAAVVAQADGFVPHAAVTIADPPPPETVVPLEHAGVLTGRVVDARGYPVDGATVEIVGTDRTGGPILDEPRRASFRAAHFAAMLPGPAPLQPAGELGVTVGPVPPIPGALTQLAGSAMSSIAPALDASPWVTSEDGTFRAEPASPGRVRAVVRHPQYVEAQSDVVSLTPGGEAHVDVVMHQGGSIEGRVYDAHDRPVAGVRIFVSATRGTLERMTRAGSDGTFAFASLPDNVTLAVAAEEDETPDVRMNVTVPEGGRKEVDVHLPEPRGPVSVTVVDDRGRPLEMVQVTASSLSTDSPLRVTAFTDARGEVELRRAHGLPLRIEAQAPSRAPKTLTVDRKADAVRIELDVAESIDGEVVAARGRSAIAGADVSLTTESGTRHSRTDSQGRFAMQGLARGNGKLRVRASGFAPATRSIAIPDSGGRRTYAVDRIELEEEGAAEGDVVDDHGEPVAGARVAVDHVPTWLLVGANPVTVAVTDSKGRFLLRELPEGSITIEAYAPELGRARVSDVKVVAGRTADRVHIVIAPETGDAGRPEEPKASGGVAVTLGETGTPPEVVVVSVVDASGAERAGVAPGDVLLGVDDVPVVSIDQARSKLSGPIADDVVLRLRREGRPLVLRVARDAVRR